MSQSNGTTKHEPSVGVKRHYCRRCGRYEYVTITSTTDGWETWEFHGCGKRKRYRVR